ncbi:MAG: hypothetical protein KDJ35_01445 [Alphaproteobacteria bacterium]|nr:hypothetical protein [Alphaproteobacteria bacterium]
MTRLFRFYIVLGLALAIGVASASAQEELLPAPDLGVDEVPQAQPEEGEIFFDASQETVQSVEQAATPSVQVEEDGLDRLIPDMMRSIVFMPWEYAAIQDAKNSRGLARPTTDDELMREMAKASDRTRVKPPPEERDITLGGIVYKAPGTWTIWLNGKRVTPSALPEEIVDIKVFSDYIEMKWYDDWTNQIVPLRLRAHQRFNIDTRIFLPG